MRQPSYRQILGTFLLLVTAFLWGMAFVGQRQGAEFLDAASFNSLRFLVGGIFLLPLVLFPLFRSASRDISRENSSRKAWRMSEILAGLTGGLIMCVGINLQQWGLENTTATKGGFITGLYVIFVAFIGVFFKQKITKNIWFATFLALTGLFFLTGAKDLENFTKGDALVLLSAFVWACHVQYLGWASPRYHVFRFAVVQAFSCAFFSSLILSTLVVFGDISWPLWADIQQAAPALLYTGVFSTAIGFTIQIIAQGMVPPTTAAIIMSLESVFAMLGGWLILHENITEAMVLGACLMLAAMILAELKFDAPKVFRKSPPKKLGEKKSVPPEEF